MPLFSVHSLMLFKSMFCLNVLLQCSQAKNFSTMKIISCLFMYVAHDVGILSSMHSLMLYKKNVLSECLVTMLTGKGQNNIMPFHVCGTNVELLSSMHSLVLCKSMFCLNVLLQCWQAKDKIISCLFMYVAHVELLSSMYSLVLYKSMFGLNFLLQCWQAKDFSRWK